MWCLLFRMEKKRKKGEGIKMKNYCSCQFNKGHSNVDKEGKCTYCRLKVRP